MPAYTSTPGKSKAVQAYGGKVTKKRPGSNVALGPAPTTYSPSYSSSSSSGATSTSSSGATTTSSPPRRTAAQRRASRIRKVARITKDPKPKKIKTPKLKARKPEKPQKVKSPGLARNERSLPTATIKAAPRDKNVAKAIISPGKPTKIRAPESPKIEGRKEKLVAKRLTRAARKSQGGLAAKLDRGFQQGYAGDDLEQITPKEAAIVMEAHGLPGITYSKAIMPGESNYRPGVRNPDDGTPSLVQITPSVQSAETQAKFDKIASKHKGGYANPIVAAKQAKVLAGDSADEGVSNYVAHNPSAPHGHLPGGQKAARQALYGKPKPIAKRLKRKAIKVLGKETAKKVVKEAKKPVSTVPTKQPGKYAGTQGIIRELIGPKYAKRVDWKDKEPREGTGSMHDTDNPNSFAADLSIDEGGLDTEKLVDRIAKKLGLDPKEVNYGTTGLESGITYKGYAIEFLPYDHGSGPHVHIAAEWTGEGLPPGTVSGGGTAGISAGTTTSSGGTSTTTSGKGTTNTRKARRRSERARSRKQLLNEILNAPDAQPADPLEGYTRPATRTATRTQLGL